MKFNILKCNESGFNDVWDKFVMENDNAGPFYLRLFMEQMLNRGSSKKRGDDYETKNMSFIIQSNKDAVCIVPLIIEKSGNKKFFSTNLGFNTFYSPLIKLLLNESLRIKIRNFAINEIELLAKKNNILKSIFAIDPINYFYEKEYYNYLHCYGFIDATIATHVIDLSLNLKKLKSNLRKSYTSIINKGLRTFKFSILDKNNADYDLFDNYRILHEKAAGIATRSRKSFDSQYEMLINNFATLIFVSFDNKIIHANYFNHNNRYVFYSSSASDPTFNQKETPVNHATIWSAIEHFKNKDYLYFDVGFQRFNPQFMEYTDKKLIDISFFKRGFGGINIPVFRGVKYYDSTLMEKELMSNCKRLLTN